MCRPWPFCLLLSFNSTNVHTRHCRFSQFCHSKLSRSTTMCNSANVEMTFGGSFGLTRNVNRCDSHCFTFSSWQYVEHSPPFGTKIHAKDFPQFPPSRFHLNRNGKQARTHAHTHRRHSLSSRFKRTTVCQMRISTLPLPLLPSVFEWLHGR